MRFSVALAVSVGCHAIVAWALVGFRASSSRWDEAASVSVREIRLTVVSESDGPPREASPSVRAAGVSDERFDPPAAEGPPALVARIPSVVPPPPDAAEAPPQEASAPERFSVVVETPARTRTAIEPRYPRQARLRGEEGSVTVETLVGSDGRAVSPAVVVSSGSAELDAAALESVRKAAFEPARSSGGRPVPSVVRLSIVFRLRS